jgi:HK97 family phage prohead protease
MEHKNIVVNFRIADSSTRKITVAEAKQFGMESELEVFEFEGHGSTFGNVDFGGDRVKRGAFSDTISDLNSKNEKLPVFWFHDSSQPVGVFTFLREDDKGLFVNGIMPKDDDFVRGRVMPQMKIGSVRKMSIGYSVIDSEMNGDIRDLIKLKLWEISLVSLPMNDQAAVTDFKTAVSFQDLPLASRDRPWDNIEARSAVRRWAGADDDAGLSDTDTQAKYRRAFLWYDTSNPELFGSYKLPIATVSDGRLVAVPRAIFAAAAAVRGARGGVDIPAGDIPGVIRHINRYYTKMGLESPFTSKKDAFRVDDLSVIDERVLEDMLKFGVRFGTKISKALISAIKASGLRDGEGGNRDGETMAGVLSEIKKLNSEVENHG